MSFVMARKSTSVWTAGAVSACLVPIKHLCRVHTHYLIVTWCQKWSATIMEFRPPKELIINENIAANWKFFQQKFEIYLKASGNDIKPDEVKVAMLLNCVGDEALKRLIRLSSPMKRPKNLIRYFRHLTSFVSLERTSSITGLSFSRADKRMVNCLSILLLLLESLPKIVTLLKKKV